MRRGEKNPEGVKNGKGQNRKYSERRRKKARLKLRRGQLLRVNGVCDYMGSAII